MDRFALQFNNRTYEQLVSKGSFARDLSVQASLNGAFAFDHFAHAFELLGMYLTPSLVTQHMAFFVVSLLELYAFCLGSFNQFDASHRQ